MHFAHYRLTSVLASQPMELLERLQRGLGASSVHDLEERLVDPFHIAEVAEALTGNQQFALHELLQGRKAAPEDADALTELGIAFPVADEADSVVVPIEIRIAFVNWDPWSASLAALLADDEDHDLESLAELHDADVTDADAEDVVGVAIAIADALLAADHVAGLFESLHASARNLLFWLCEHAAPVPITVLRRRAAQLGERFGETNGTADRVLLRLGLLRACSDGEQTVHVIPADVRTVLVPILDANLADRCFEAWDRLRGAASPAFGDIMPRGIAGDALAAFRLRALRGISEGLQIAHPVDELLVRMGIVEDPESPAPSLQASWFLDLSGPEPFARTMLRYWCDLLNDEFTDALIDAFGGDAFALADWMMRTCIPQNPEQLPDDINSQALARWSEFLFVLRGHLIVALSVMPPGYWHRMDHLASWFTTVYRRVTWQIGRSWTQIEEFPDQYLPVSSVDVHPDLEPTVRTALETLFRGLLQVVGAVRFDSSEKLFMINPEALRSFGDHDLASSPHLEAAEAYLGDDMHLWLPMPIDSGVRQHGIAPLTFTTPNVIRVPGDAHFNDLAMLAAWSHVDTDGIGNLLFTLTTESVAIVDRERGEIDHMRAWLHARLPQGVPTGVAALFRRPASRGRETSPSGMSWGLAHVRALLQELDDYGEAPPGVLLEQIRSWGQVASALLLRRVQSWVAQRKWNAPALPACCLLLGELHDTAAVVPLLRTLGFSDNLDAEAAACVALARIGEDGLAGLAALLANEGAEFEKRFQAATALAAIAVLHPHLMNEACSPVMTAIESSDLEPDMVTTLALCLADTGNPEAETVLYRVKERGLWDEQLFPFDEALWVSAHSPCIWGPPAWSYPIAHLFPPPRPGEPDNEEIDAGFEEDEQDDTSTTAQRSRRGRLRRSGR